MPHFVPLIVALSLAGGAGSLPAASQPAAAQVLSVPYLSQTEALCGGAAVAMLFRYWGERHAAVQQFEPLVDRRAGGIAQNVLVDAVRARGWRALTFQGTIDSIRDRLADKQPLVLLIEDRPGRYHYVVAVGVDDAEVTVHDPAWGPLRRYSTEELLRAWQPAEFWSLLILPGADGVPAPPEPPDNPTPPPRRTDVLCDLLLDAALNAIATRGLQAADEVLGRVRAGCPRDARPVGELAGVRFAAERWDDAAALAGEAIGIDPTNTYAWDVLGSSRFMKDDLPGALRAWNHIGKPRLDSVQIEGLTHTRYSLVAQTLRLSPNTVLTERDYRLAERRLQQLPNRVATRMGYRPEADGFAVVGVAVTERPARPYGPVQWGAALTEALATREVKAFIPGSTGQGEVWAASWRWWDERPRVAMSFTVPRVGPVAGVWRVDGAWEKQTYFGTRADSKVTEQRVHAGIALADWIDPDLRYEAGIGVDSWNGSRRTISIGGELERRLMGDRLSVTGSARVWNGFRAGGVSAAFRSSAAPDGMVYLARLRVDAVSEDSPLALWPGAGTGDARSSLLRAHPLLSDGVVTGPVFGRRVIAGGGEVQRWLQRPALVRVAVAGFVDAARPVHFGGTGRGHVDAGVGLRVRVPGNNGTLRLDYARGLRDGANAVSAGVTFN